MRTAVTATTVALALGLLTSIRGVSAAPVYLPPGSNLTFGEVTHTQRVFSAENNPAAAAALGAGLEAGESGRGMAGSLTVGEEFGNVQELFDTIDELSRRYRPTPPGQGGGGPGQPPKPPDGIDIGDIIDWAFPELRPALEAVAREVATQVTLLGIISTEGYARAYASLDLPFVLSHDILGGSLTAGLTHSGTAKAFGVADGDIEFDLEAALEDLARQIQDALDDLLLEPGLPPLVFDVVGDVDFIADPTSNEIRYQLDNDSLLLSKSTQLTELSVGYSRSLFANQYGQLFAGAEAKFYDMALSRISVRFGDITDSEELFQQIRNADSRRDSDFGVDLGVLWRGDRYQLGATLTNVNEPTFRYPSVELTPYRKPRIIEALLADEVYTMERQLKLEGALLGADQRWAVNLGIDANSVTDPVGDEFQWATVSGAWNTNTSWLPNVRFGYRKNLVGTEVSYVSAGVQLFRFFNLDFASSLDTVSIQGDKLPRGLMLSMGFAVEF